MDGSTRRNVRRAGGPSRSSLAISVAVLLCATVWAFTVDVTPPAGVPGIRVGPTDAYNPVLAGEPLPDGFRQLLPRDAIRPVYDPRFVPAADVTWLASTDVIGVAMGGEAKAYPVSYLNGRELVVDEIDKVPILVSW